MSKKASEMDDAGGGGKPEKDRPENRVAFVLSGGGNRGALEVGVLLALFEHDIRPHILVGTSVGAMNAAAIAEKPTLEGARWLEEVWQGVTKRDVMPNNLLSMVWRLVTGESGLVDNQNLRGFLESKFPEGVRRFADIRGAELYITAVDLHTGDLHVFGIDRSESILDAIMASAALPLLLSPWEYRGRQYVDGAVISDLPVRVAVDAGATEVYAIDVGRRARPRGGPRGIFRVIRQTMDAVARQQLTDELEWANKLPHVDIHYMSIHAFEGIRIWDFSHTPEMIEEGRRVALEHLSRHGVV